MNSKGKGKRFILIASLTAALLPVVLLLLLLSQIE
jgi:hypothetical protein